MRAARRVASYTDHSGSEARNVGRAASEAAFAFGSIAKKVAAARVSRTLRQVRNAALALTPDLGIEINVEQANTRDVSDLLSGVRPDQIARLALWPGRDLPPFVAEHWERLKAALKHADEGWEVWVDWYEARLEGLVREQKVELAYVEFVRKVVDSAAASAANAEIKRLIDAASSHAKSLPSSDSPPKVPGRKPAAVEPVVRRGRLTLPNVAVEVDMKGTTIPASLKALKQSLTELAEIAADEQNNIDKRFAARLDEIAKGVPIKRPNQVELFRLGHFCDELGNYRNTVADTWPEHHAPRYMAATLAFERTLRRFPKWVDFTREPPIAKLTGQAARQVAQAAQSLSGVIGEAENLTIVDPVLPEALDRFSRPLALAATQSEASPEPIELGMDLLALDVLESVNNVLKIIAEQAMAAKAKIGEGGHFASDKLGSYGKEFGKRADRSLRRSAGQLGDKVGPACIKLAKWTLYAKIGAVAVHSQGPLLAAWLIQNYPQMFSWLGPVMAFLH